MTFPALEIVPPRFASAGRTKASVATRVVKRDGLGGPSLGERLGCQSSSNFSDFIA